MALQYSTHIPLWKIFQLYSSNRRQTPTKWPFVDDYWNISGIIKKFAKVGIIPLIFPSKINTFFSWNLAKILEYKPPIGLFFFLFFWNIAGIIGLCVEYTWNYSWNIFIPVIFPTFLSKFIPPIFHWNRLYPSGKVPLSRHGNGIILH